MGQENELSYGSHLRLDRILDAQAPVSDSHDELLFIIQHQTSELWFRLVIAELDAARARLRAGNLRGAGKALRRIGRVLEHLGASWDVLRSLDPLDFLSFRGDLGTASGFQSWQYRRVEFTLGNRSLDMLAAHRESPERMAMFEAELSRPSLYQVALHLLQERLGVELPGDAFSLRTPYERQAPVRDAWARVYANAADHPDLFDLAEQLIALEDRFRCWRFNHVTTVERVIGTKQGTGGTSGVSYLRAMLEHSFFPELWELRSTL